MSKLHIPQMRKTILTGLFIAIYVVLDRVLTINSEIIKLNFSIVIVAVSAVFLGPKYSVLVGAIGDLIGSLTMPFGPYFPGFTISTGLCRTYLWNSFI